MYIVHVHVHVLPGSEDAFAAASAANHAGSIAEPGVARFDVLQSVDDPTRFVLVEVYVDADAAAAHKQTAHYATWRDTVAEMMAEPRSAVRYGAIAPDASGW